MRTENLDKIIELRHELHRHPELSLQELGTIKRLQNFLRDYTSLEIFDRDGWFYAVKNGRDPKAPKIAFRADMDALPIDETGAGSVPLAALDHISQNPGISHKCGHDGHCAALCGLALELDGRETDRTVYFIFQKGEEIGKGGAEGAEPLREEGIEEVYAFHNRDGFPEGTVVYRKGLTQPASEGLSIHFTGKKAHASAPETGRNPAVAIAKTALFAESFNEAERPDDENAVQPDNANAAGLDDTSGLPSCAKQPDTGRENRPLILCTITGMNAGTGDFGIAAGEGSLQLTLRAEREEDMAAMERQILSCAREQAEIYGLEVREGRSDVFPETRNTEAGIERVLSAVHSLNIPAMESPEIWRASEDFGYYLKISQGAIIYVGCGETWPALHTVGYDFNDRILETAVDLLVELAVR